MQVLVTNPLDNRPPLPPDHSSLQSSTDYFFTEEVRAGFVHPKIDLIDSNQINANWLQSLLQKYVYPLGLSGLLLTGGDYTIYLHICSSFKPPLIFLFQSTDHEMIIFSPFSLSRSFLGVSLVFSTTNHKAFRF